jgi:hypothetical protein
MSMHVRLGCEVKCEASALENFEFSNRPPTMNLFRIAGNPWILYEGAAFQKPTIFMHNGIIYIKVTPHPTKITIQNKVLTMKLISTLTF